MTLLHRVIGAGYQSRPNLLYFLLGLSAGLPCRNLPSCLRSIAIDGLLLAQGSFAILGSPLSLSPRVFRCSPHRFPGRQRSSGARLYPQHGAPRGQRHRVLIHRFPHFREVASAAGNDVEQDWAKAKLWLERVARQGHAEAQFSLGHIYGDKYRSRRGTNHRYRVHGDRRYRSRGNEDLSRSIAVDN